MTITLDEQDQALLHAEAERRGQDPSHLAAAALRAGLAALATLPAPQEILPLSSEVDPGDQAWWNTLTAPEQEAERAAAARGLADIDAGRTRPADAVYERVRAKFTPLHSSGAAQADADAA
jgi:predicted transcriptional regulator